MSSFASVLARLLARLAVCSLAGLLLASSFASALVAHIDLTVFANNTVSLDNIAVLEGEPDEPLQQGDATVVLWQDEEHYRTGVALPFFALDPWRELDRQQINVNLPYIGNRGSIILFRNLSVLWSYDLSRLCDRNTVCTGEENALSCTDCYADADSYCNLESGDCDPDCREGLDKDCAAAMPGYFPYVFSLLAAAIVIITYLILRRRAT